MKRSFCITTNPEVKFKSGDDIAAMVLQIPPIKNNKAAPQRNYVAGAAKRSKTFRSYWLFMYLRKGISPRHTVPSAINKLDKSE